LVYRDLGCRRVCVPSGNIILAIACVALVLTIRSSDHIAAAYGLAVSATMLATTSARSARPFS
jgi:KUP system potassium uptake protein